MNIQEEMPFKCPLLVILLFTVYRILFNSADLLRFA